MAWPPEYTPPDPWRYLPVLNECIKILLTIALGAIFGYFKIFDAKTFCPIAIRFVFYAALPFHILRGIGSVNFYDDSFLWNYIAAFLILRVIALFGIFAIVLAKAVIFRKGGIGEVAVLWLSLTWISTVILGIPISEAVFGNKFKGMFYGLLAGISSFIFQLPLQLLFLECHALEREYMLSRKSNDIENGKVSASVSPLEQDENAEDVEGAPPDDNIAAKVPAETASNAVDGGGVDDNIAPIFLWASFIKRGDVWKRIVIQVLRNPVIWGITAGFVLSLSKIGPTFLKSASEDAVPGLKWLFDTFEWLGACVSPVSLITMGIWLQDRGYQLFFKISHRSAFIFMTFKCFLVPLLMVGLAKLCDLNDEAGRAAVLIAALPISMASFSLAGRYGIGESVLSENVALGTALMLPTIILWNLALDAVGLFPVPQPGSM